MLTQISNTKNKENLSPAAQNNRSSRNNRRSPTILNNLKIQAKLSVGQPNDKYEQEADRVADQVMGISNADVAQRVGSGRIQPMQIQRMCVGCEEETAQRQPIEEEQEKLQTKPLLQRQLAANEEEETLRAKSGSENSPVSPQVSFGIQSTRGRAQGLASQPRSFMESRFGRDFSSVNIHTAGYADKMSRDLNAKAFTVGNDIYFKYGQYQTNTERGKHLLAHELAHTVQQSIAGLGIMRTPIPFNADALAYQLDDAMRGWGTDEEAIYSALAGRTSPKVAEIASAYLSLTGRTLQADLISELTESELLHLASVSAPFAGSSPASSAEVVARQLFEAMDGLGTNEESIYAAVTGRTAVEFASISVEYLRLFGTALMTDLRDELTNSEYARLQASLGVSPGCTAAETSSIQGSMTTVTGWVSTALSKLGAIPTTPAVSAVLSANFGLTDGVPANIPHFVRAIRRANGEMLTVAISCKGAADRTCSTGPCGYVPSAGSHELVICSNNTLQPATDPIYRGGCLLHEAFHSVSTSFSGDSYSGWGGHSSSSPGYPGADPMTNADSYASLVIDLR